jgi:predicted DNA-binding transcriptional regulator AlpA
VYENVTHPMTSHIETSGHVSLVLDLLYQIRLFLIPVFKINDCVHKIKSDPFFIFTEMTMSETKFEITSEKIIETVSEKIPEKTELFLTADQCAKRYQISERHFRQLVRLGQLPKPLKFGHCSRWAIKILEDFEARKIQKQQRTLTGIVASLRNKKGQTFSNTPR